MKENFTILNNGQWNLKKTISEEAFTLIKSLFPKKEECDSLAIPSSSSKTKEDIARDLEWKIDSLKYLKEKTYLINETVFEDEDDLNAVKKVLEARFNHIKKEILDLTKEFNDLKKAKIDSGDSLSRIGQRIERRSTKDPLEEKDRGSFDPKKARKMKSGEPQHIEVGSKTIQRTKF